jgi:protein AaeX
MRFAEVDLLGVYVAPMSVIMIAAWFVTVTLQIWAARFGLLRYVWHRSLFVLSIYMIVLSSIVLVVGRLSHG